MKVEMWDAHTSVRNNIDKVAVSRGPIVYCLEEVDNGENLHLLSLDKNTEFTYQFREDLLGGVGVINAKGSERSAMSSSNSNLYQKHKAQIETKERELMLIPYFAWGNRGENEMRVWIRQER